jgi:hypothetical protein
MLCTFYVFSSTKSEKGVELLPRSGVKGRRGSWRRREMVQTMYTHVSKCKNDKRKKEKKSITEKGYWSDSRCRT